MCVLPWQWRKINSILWQTMLYWLYVACFMIKHSILTSPYHQRQIHCNQSIFFLSVYISVQKELLRRLTEAFPTYLYQLANSYKFWGFIHGGVYIHVDTSCFLVMIASIFIFLCAFTACSLYDWTPVPIIPWSWTIYIFTLGALPDYYWLQWFSCS